MKKNGNIRDCGLILSGLIITAFWLEQSLFKAVVIAIELSIFANLVSLWLIFKRILLCRLSLVIGIMSAMAFIPIWDLAYPFWYVRPNTVYLLVLLMVSSYCACVSFVCMYKIRSRMIRVF